MDVSEKRIKLYELRRDLENLIYLLKSASEPYEGSKDFSIVSTAVLNNIVKTQEQISRLQ